MKATLHLLVLFLSLSVLPSYAADAPKRGEVTGGVIHEPPDWFKESFLEIADDVDEAAEENKHVLLFFQLNGCPYCDRMLEESFESASHSEFIQEHFDTIAINIQGDREIAFNEEISVTEKELGEILKVRATPAIVFLNKENKTITRVNGYRSPERFMQVLKYVSTNAYENSTLADYLQETLNNNVYTLRPNKLFTETNDLSSIKGPLMVIFEDGSCYDCNEFHNGVLANDLVKKEIKPFTIVRLDADSDQTIIDTDGKKTTPKEMAKKLDVVFRPGVLAFNEGQLLRRHDSLTFPHHFKESMRFVAGDFYKKMDYRSYSEQRTEELLSQGVTIDLSKAKIK